MADRPVRTSAVGRLGRRWPLRVASTVILVVQGGVVAASCVITLNVIRDQERLILQERTGEAAAVLDSEFASVQDSLQLLGGIAASDPARRPLFARAARSVF